MGRWLHCHLSINNRKQMIISIIIGLCIWFVVPILLEGHIKGKNNKKALRMVCKIIGVVIICWTIYNHIIYSL